MSLDVISFIESHFDKIKEVPSTEGQYRVSPCPNCGKDKYKLYINVDKRVFNCFSCGYGKGERIERLFYDMGSNPRDYYIDDGNDSYRPSKETAKVTPAWTKTLPIEFKDIIGNNSIKGRMAHEYLRGRGISDSLIAEYRMGFCYEGEYNDRIIIPYYENSELVYFTGRDFTGNLTPKYLNPSWEKNTFLFNYDRVKKQSLDTIIIVEGPMDILSVPDLSVCLLGKFLTFYQEDIIKRYKNIYIALDPDAITYAYDIAATINKLSNSSNVYVVRFQGDDDPSSVGYSGMMELLKTAELVGKDMVDVKTLGEKTDLVTKDRVLKTVGGETESDFSDFFATIGGS